MGWKNNGGGSLLSCMQKGDEFTMIRKDQQSKAGKAELCNRMQVPADPCLPGALTPNREPLVMS